MRSFAYFRSNILALMFAVFACGTLAHAQAHIDPIADVNTPRSYLPALPTCGISGIAHYGAIVTLSSTNVTSKCTSSGWVAMGTSNAVSYADAYCASVGTLDYTCIANAVAANSGKTVIVPNLVGSSVYNLSQPITISQSNVKVQFQHGVTLHNTATVTNNCAVTVTGNNVEIDDLTIEDNQNAGGFLTGPLCLYGSNIIVSNLTILPGAGHQDSTIGMVITGSHIFVINPTIDPNLTSTIIPPASDVWIQGGNVGAINTAALSGGGVMSNIHLEGIHATAQGWEHTCFTPVDLSNPNGSGPLNGLWIEDNTCTVNSTENVETITGFSITNGIATINVTNSFYPGEEVSITGLSVGTYLNTQSVVLPTGLSSSQFQVLTTHANLTQTTDSGQADVRAFGAISLPSFDYTSVYVEGNVVNSANAYVLGPVFEIGCTFCTISRNTFNVSDPASQAEATIAVYGADTDIEGNVFNGGFKLGAGISFYPQHNNGTVAHGDNNIVRGNIFNNPTSAAGAHSNAVEITCNYAGGSSLNTIVSENVVVGSWGGGVVMQGNGFGCAESAQVVLNTFNGPLYGVVAQSPGVINHGANVYTNVGTHTYGSGTLVNTY